METKYIYIMLILYLYVIFCSIAYISFSNFRKDFHTRSINKINATFGNKIFMILEKIKTGQDIEKEELELVKQKIKSKKYKEVFDSRLIKFNDKEDNIKYTKIFMGNFENEVKVFIKRYEKSNDFKKSHIVYMLGQYGVDSSFTNEFLINKLDTNSLNLKFNILKSIALIGNKEYFYRALTYLSKAESVKNEHIITDIIEQFSGDKKELDKLLLKKISNFNEIFKKAIIMSLKTNSYIDASSLLLEKLKKRNISKPILFNILKYFENNEYIQVRDYLINYLKSDDELIRIQVAKSLRFYKDEKTTSALLQGICDRNWYVRFECAKNLLDVDDYKDVLLKIIDTNDKFAKDIALYILSSTDRIAYKDALEDYKEIKLRLERKKECLKI